MAKDKRVTAEQVNNALRKRFCQPEWNIFFEVRDSTGFGGSRTADAVAMNCYPSRGMEIWGFEVKVYRNDWLRELRAPEKSAPVQKYCDRWYIVAPAGLVPVGELPVTWDLFELVDKGELRMAKQAPELKAEPVTREFVASLMRGSVRASAGEIQDLVYERTRELQARIDGLIDQASQADRVARTEAFKKLEEIKAATGIDLNSWTPAANVIATLRLVLDAGVVGRHSELTRILGSLRRTQADVEKTMRALGMDVPAATLIE